jgi:hypothetical protein
MANKKFLLGMLAITLVFGLMVVACDPEADPALNGKWKELNGTSGKYTTLEFSNGSYTRTDVDSTGSTVVKGNYITSGGYLITTPTSRTYSNGTTNNIPPASQSSATMNYSIKNGKLYISAGAIMTVFAKQ